MPFPDHSYPVTLMKLLLPFVVMRPVPLGAGILSHIPIQDLSDLLVMCVQRNSSSSSDVSMLSRSTAVCGTKKVQGPTTWSSLVETVRNLRSTVH